MTDEQTTSPAGDRVWPYPDIAEVPLLAAEILDTLARAVAAESATAYGPGLIEDLLLRGAERLDYYGTQPAPAACRQIAAAATTALAFAAVVRHGAETVSHDAGLAEHCTARHEAIGGEALARLLTMAARVCDRTPRILRENEPALFPSGTAARPAR